jgi:hypothetical protein
MRGAGAASTIGVMLITDRPAADALRSHLHGVFAWRW